MQMATVASDSASRTWWPIDSAQRIERSPRSIADSSRPSARSSTASAPITSKRSPSPDSFGRRFGTFEKTAHLPHVAALPRRDRRHRVGVGRQRVVRSVTELSDTLPPVHRLRQHCVHPDVAQRTHDSQSGICIIRSDRCIDRSPEVDEPAAEFIDRERVHRRAEQESDLLRPLEHAAGVPHLPRRCGDACVVMVRCEPPNHVEQREVASGPMGERALDELCEAFGRVALAEPENGCDVASIERTPVRGRRDQRLPAGFVQLAVRPIDRSFDRAMTFDRSSTTVQDRDAPVQAGANLRE